LQRPGTPRVHMLVIAAFAMGLLGADRALATIRLQREALGAGFPAANCGYCHSFDREHMQKKAREMGLNTTNCMVCHGDRLPKSGADLMNDRGKWLLAEKTKRKAAVVDMVWLKTYVEPSPAAK
jgi:hypothetical protein